MIFFILAIMDILAGLFSIIAIAYGQFTNIALYLCAFLIIKGIYCLLTSGM